MCEAKTALSSGFNVDLLVRSGIWVGACAVALLAASAQSMGVDPDFGLLALAGVGTAGVYGFDRWAARGGSPDPAFPSSYDVWSHSSSDSSLRSFLTAWK